MAITTYFKPKKWLPLWDLSDKQFRIQINVWSILVFRISKCNLSNMLTLYLCTYIIGLCWQLCVCFYRSLGWLSGCWTRRTACRWSPPTWRTRQPSTRPSPGSLTSQNRWGYHKILYNSVLRKFLAWTPKGRSLAQFGSGARIMLSVEKKKI